MIDSSKMSTDMKLKKALWLLMPTQLFIQGQWWSNLSQQRLQMAQWRDLDDLIT